MPAPFPGGVSRQRGLAGTQGNQWMRSLNSPSVFSPLQLHLDAPSLVLGAPGGRRPRSARTFM
eukprot:10850773-Alexandrium_andersonii.AAC.1